jgi:hypothetical protein
VGKAVKGAVKARVTVAKVLAVADLLAAAWVQARAAGARRAEEWVQARAAVDLPFSCGHSLSISSVHP